MLLIVFTFSCSGDTDSVVPVTATRFALNHLNLTIKTPWYPWYTGGQVFSAILPHELSTLIELNPMNYLSNDLATSSTIFTITFYSIVQIKLSIKVFFFFFFFIGRRMDRSVRWLDLCNRTRSRT